MVTKSNVRMGSPRQRPYATPTQNSEFCAKYHFHSLRPPETSLAQAAALRQASIVTTPTSERITAIAIPVPRGGE